MTTKSLVSEEQTRKNLASLSEYLKAFSKQENAPFFDMESFYTSNFTKQGVAEDECGTAACAVGHYAVMIGWDASSEGVKPKTMTPEWEAEYKRNSGAIGRMSWCDFTTNIIGVDASEDEAHLFAWLFASRWEGYDNSPLGAALRIDYFLEHGIPNSFISSPSYFSYNYEGGLEACEPLKEAYLAKHTSQHKESVK